MPAGREACGDKACGIKAVLLSVGAQPGHAGSNVVELCWKDDPWFAWRAREAVSQ